MNKPVYIFGAGGHAAVIEEILSNIGIDIAGNVVDSGYEPKNLDRRIIETVEFLSNTNPEECFLVFGIGTASSTKIKKSRVELFRKSGFEFISLIADSSVISPSAEIQLGAQVFEGTVITSGARVESHAVINTGAIIEHGAVVGEFCHIAPGAVVCGNAKIGPGTIVGANSTVLQNIQIGPGCTIGAGSVVTRDVPNGTTVSGVPARAH